MKLALVSALLAGMPLADAGIPSAFTIDDEARPGLHELWRTSVAAKSERVACLASRLDGDTLRILRTLPLTGAGSDSLAVLASASLETCAPPTWQGTVHTHVALYDGQRPYSNFSGADRGVMLMWWERWKANGTFCVVFSDQDVHCEMDGVEGAVMLPSRRY